jgi:hypothetical protein
MYKFTVSYSMQMQRSADRWRSKSDKWNTIFFREKLHSREQYELKQYKKLMKKGNDGKTITGNMKNSRRTEYKWREDTGLLAGHFYFCCWYRVLVCNLINNHFNKGLSKQTLVIRFSSMICELPLIFALFSISFSDFLVRFVCLGHIRFVWV